MTIQSVSITNLYGNDYKWQLNSDVNILIGANGTYKSTILQIIDSDYHSIGNSKWLYSDYLLECPNLKVEITKDNPIKVNFEDEVDELKDKFSRADKLIKEIIPSYKSYQECSAGQRSLLSIFACKGDIVILDNPENNLHIDWQRNLIKWIRELNPTCQIILTTHSPTIYYQGWIDKVTRIEEIKINQAG